MGRDRKEAGGWGWALRLRLRLRLWLRLCLWLWLVLAEVRQDVELLLKSVESTWSTYSIGLERLAARRSLNSSSRWI